MFVQEITCKNDTVSVPVFVEHRFFLHRNLTVVLSESRLLLLDKYLAPVVQSLNSAIQWINTTKTY